MGSTILALAVGLCGLLVPAQASFLAAFYTPPWVGAQVIYQNASTGEITHSLCNSYGKPIFPRDPPRSFPLPYASKNGTSVAATGWSDGTTNWATLFYQSINNEIIQAVFKCDMVTGSFTQVSSAVVSGVKTAPTPHLNTGLAINLLGESNGEHLYYHDGNKSVNLLTFNNDVKWAYGGKVSPDTNIGGLALATAFLGSNETIFTPKDKSNVEMSVLNSDHTYKISTFPQSLASSSYSSASKDTNPSYSRTSKSDLTLPAWDGNPGALGASIDMDNTKYLFYIGTDKKLHLATSKLDSGEREAFEIEDEADTKLWPEADESNGDLGLAYNPASYDVTLFYFSGGSLVTVNQTAKRGGWQEAYTLPEFNTTTGDSSDSGSGLSKGKKAGIGVGAGLAGLLLLGGIGLYCLRQRRRKQEAQRQSTMPSEMVMGPNGEMYPTNQYDMQQQMGVQPGYDYTQVQQYDYSQQDYNHQQWGADKKAISPGPHDMYGQVQPVAAEMPDSSPAQQRLSELPSGHLSHELPAADVDRIQTVSPEPQSGYPTGTDQAVSQHNYNAIHGDANALGAISPPQRAVSDSSWTTRSPPPHYVSQSTSPAPSNAYGQQQPYQTTQPISPQLTGTTVDYQYSGPSSYTGESGYGQNYQTQPQQERESLGAITEQHEGSQGQQYQQHHQQYEQQPQLYAQQPQQYEQQQHYGQQNPQHQHQHQHYQ